MFNRKIEIPSTKRTKRHGYKAEEKVRLEVFSYWMPTSNGKLSNEYYKANDPSTSQKHFGRVSLQSRQIP